MKIVNKIYIYAIAVLIGVYISCTICQHFSKKIGQNINTKIITIAQQEMKFTGYATESELKEKTLIPNNIIGSWKCNETGQIIDFSEKNAAVWSGDILINILRYVVDSEKKQIDIKYMGSYVYDISNENELKLYCIHSMFPDIITDFTDGKIYTFNKM
mgnify:FL=1